MPYFDTVSGTYPLFEEEIKSRYPNVSFPTPFVPPERYKFVFPTPLPNYDPVIHYARQTQPALDLLGNYVQTWEIVDIYANPADRAAAINADRRKKDEKFNADVDAQLLANDMKIIRALVENDTAAINAHKTSQAALRSQKKPI